MDLLALNSYFVQNINNPKTREDLRVFLIRLLVEFGTSEPNQAHREYFKYMGISSLSVTRDPNKITGPKIGLTFFLNHTRDNKTIEIKHEASWYEIKLMMGDKHIINLVRVELREAVKTLFVKLDAELRDKTPEKTSEVSMEKIQIYFPDGPSKDKYTDAALEIDRQLHEAIAGVLSRYLPNISAREFGALAHSAVEQVVIESLL